MSILNQKGNQAYKSIYEKLKEKEKQLDEFSIRKLLKQGKLSEENINMIIEKFQINKNNKEFNEEDLYKILNYAAFIQKEDDFKDEDFKIGKNKK